MNDQLDFPISIPSAASRMPSEPIVRSAEIEDNYRWIARRAWGGGPCVLWVLLNPSIADSRKDDPTMLRMIGFSFRWGFGSLAVCNLYPFISPNPNALHRWRKSWRPEDEYRGGPYEYEKSAMNAWLHNMDKVRDAIKSTQTHVAAWGNQADQDDLGRFLSEVTYDYDTIGSAKYRVTGDDGEIIPVEWQCLGMTSLGNPIHPLARGTHRVPDDTALQPWKRK